MTFDRRTKEIVLFGEKVFLFERTLGQMYAFAEYAKTEKEVNMLNNAILSISVIRDSLQPNIERLKFYQLFRKRKLKKLFSTDFLFKNLTRQQISDYCSIIIEDIEAGKKKEGAEESL